MHPVDPWALTSQDVWTLLSLALTPQTIIVCFGVVALFWDVFVEAVRALRRSDMQWFVVGVVLGFTGDGFDNIYWGAAWSWNFITYGEPNVLFEMGAASNIPFRQGAGIAAALCHARASIVSRSVRFRVLLGVGWAIGPIYALSLYLIRPFL